MQIIKDIFERYNVMFKNFSYLTVLEVFKLALPLITYPYLIRVLGLDTYGLVIFAQAIIAYFAILINFGFDISATKRVSINRGNKVILNQIVSSVFIIKLFLFILSSILLISLIYLVPRFQEHALLFLFSIALCLQELVIPIWYFQGMEQMKYITIISLISRITFTIMVFVVIKDPSDYLYVPLLNGLGGFFGGLIALKLIFNKKNIEFLIPKFTLVKYYFLESLPFFISRLSSVINITIGKILSGVYLGLEIVAYLDIAEKIVNVLKIPNNIINQVVFPQIARTKDKLFVKKILKLRISIALLFFLGILISSKYVIQLFMGEQNMLAINALNLLSINVVITAISYFTGSTILVSFGYTKQFNWSVVIATIFSISGLLILLTFNSLGLYQIIIVVILTELFVLIYRQYYCLKFKLL